MSTSGRRNSTSRVTTTAFAQRLRNRGIKLRASSRAQRAKGLLHSDRTSRRRGTSHTGNGSFLGQRSHS